MFYILNKDSRTKRKKDNKKEKKKMKNKKNKKNKEQIKKKKQINKKKQIKNNNMIIKKTLEGEIRRRRKATQTIRQFTELITRKHWLNNCHLYIV